jgi:hypothetical protein
MKVRRVISLPISASMIGAACLLVFLTAALILMPQNAAGQQPAPPKLTLTQVEGLVSNHVPDSTMRTQIERRGLAFTPTSAIVESLRAKGAGSLTLEAIEAHLPNGTRSGAISRTERTLASGFSGPSGVAVDGDGNLFITDFPPHLSPPATKEILAAGGYTTVRTLCSGPAIFGLAVSESGNLFLAGPGFYPAYEVKVAEGCPTVRILPSTWNFAKAVAVDGSGSVFVVDDGNREVAGGVREIPPGCASNGETTVPSCVKVLGGGFNSPWSVAVDKSGSVFVADTNNNAVKEIPLGCASASCVRALGGGFSRPMGVSLDRSGTIYVSDTGNNAVKEVPLGCVSADCVRTLGSDFNSPRGIAVDKRNNVFVADSDNHRVVELVAAGAKATPNAATNPPDSEPSLAVTMQFIQDKLNEQGSINYAIYVHDNTTNKSGVNQSSSEVSNVVLDPTSCHISYHIKAAQNGNLFVNQDVGLTLRDVQDIIVRTGEQSQKMVDTAAGHPTLDSRFDPHIFLVRVQLSANNGADFGFYDEAMANRVGKALTHAVDLCGGGNKKEPF